MRAPMHFSRETNVLEGAAPWERAVVKMLIAGSKVSAHFSHRGYNGCANLLRRVIAERDINVMLNPEAIFCFPFGDGYWSKLLNSTFQYEEELERLLIGVKDVDYTFVDCGANYGYWSVLVSSPLFGSHRAIAIEASSKNFARLLINAKINGRRFDLRQAAVGSKRGVARLSGTKHESLTIAGGTSALGEEVIVLALDDLLDNHTLSEQRKFIVKLDVEGVEIDAMKGGVRLLNADTMVVCEEHGNDPRHTVSRYILEQTEMRAFFYDPSSQRFEHLTSLSTLDRIKTAPNIGYSVFATASAFWADRLLYLNAKGPAKS